MGGEKQQKENKFEIIRIAINSSSKMTSNQSTGVAIYQPSPTPVIRPKTSILDKSLSRGKQEVSLSAFALLFSEMVQYCQSRSSTVPELQSKLHALGQQVGARILDIVFVREKAARRETKLLNVLLFVKSTLWKTLFGKEADKLEHANDDERTYYVIENEPLVNRFISVPKDKGSLNCAAFEAGIIEAVLDGCNFPAKVSAHWHKGTTFMVKFNEEVIARDRQMDQMKRRNVNLVFNLNKAS